MDASFLLQEGPTSHAHVGGVAILAGPPPDLAQMRTQIAGRLDLMPRYRQRLASGVLDRARPVWVDDTRFDLGYHVRHTALPAPGARAQLEAAVAQAYSQPLDRSRPLWEIWLVEGLESGAFALIFKTHHAMIDGSAAVDLLKILFDFSPDARPANAELAPWRPQPTPGSLDLLALGLREAAGAVAGVAAGALEASKTPLRSIKGGLDVAGGAGALIWELVRATPRTPLTTEIGRQRRFVAVPCRLDDIKLVKNTLGGTVNDVVLAVVSGALRRFLLGRGVDVDGLEVSALVPVSVRANGDHSLGNQLAILRGSLPVHVEDPVERLAVVTEAMSALKTSRQAPATEWVLSAQDFLPPMLLPITTKVNVSPRLFNVMVTNVPGPQVPLYVLGRELLELAPIALLQPAHALAIAAASYNGQLNFGVLGDYEALADIEVVSGGIADGLSELVARCRPQVTQVQPARSRSRRRVAV